jgi:hypothetical protein
MSGLGIVVSIRSIATSKIAKSSLSCAELRIKSLGTSPKSQFQEDIMTSLGVTTDAKAASLRSIRRGQSTQLRAYSYPFISRGGGSIFETCF